MSRSKADESTHAALTMSDSEVSSMDMASRYVLLRRLEQRFKCGDCPTTDDLAREFRVPRRSMCRYLCILQTAEEFAVPLIQEGWRWEVLK